MTQSFLHLQRWPARLRTLAAVAAVTVLSACQSTPPAAPQAAPTAAAPVAPTAAPPAAVDTPSSTTAPVIPLVGGDKDAHGCKASAGYSWCQRTQQCERPWELALKRGFENTAEGWKAFCTASEK